MVAGDLRKLAALGCFMLDRWGVSLGCFMPRRSMPGRRGCPTRGWLALSHLCVAPRGPSLTLEFVGKKQFNVCRHKSRTLRTVTFRCKRLQGQSRTGNCEGRLGFWAKVFTGDLRKLIPTVGGAPSRQGALCGVAQKVGFSFVDEFSVWAGTWCDLEKIGRECLLAV